MMKSLKEISWQVSEPEYRADPALSYSVLSRYEREGFNNIEHLFDKISTPSLIFGSCVDALITGGQEEFDTNFIVCEFPSIPDSIIQIVKTLFKFCNSTNRTLESIDNDCIIRYTELYKYQLNWKPKTRAEVIKEKGAEYYSLLYVAQDKTIIDTKTYQDVCNTVEALKNSEATRWYFQDDNPFENIERCYQLKFKATLEGIDYRVMADLIIVDHTKKEIWLTDLKTSSHTEWDFPVSFKDWSYWCQARLYYRVIKANLEKDEYFKDFKVHDYRFIVANRNTLTPLVWEYSHTKALGELVYGRFGQYKVRDPFDIGKELKHYLDNKDRVPIGIKIDELNDLLKYLNEL